MKNRQYIILLFILSRGFGGQAQESGEIFQPVTLGNYRLKAEIPMYSCHFSGAFSEDSMMVAEPGALFTIVHLFGDSAVIRFWEWKENSALNARLCFADSLCTERKYFIIACRDMDGRVVQRYSRNPGFSAGTAIIPFKLRLGQFDFSKDVTLGPTVGMRVRLSHYSDQYVNILAGLGITSVTLDMYNTRGNVEETTEVPALTPSLGFVFELTRSVQAGFFFGWDYIAHNEMWHFIYHGRPWISVGLGYSLITLNGAE